RQAESLFRASRERERRRSHSVFLPGRAFEDYVTMRAVHLKLARNHMATTFSFVVSCEQARARAAETVLEEAHRLIERLERELSEFLPESPVSRLNAARPGETVPFEGSARTVLTRSLDLRDRSAGAFDPLAKSPPAGRAAGISITADGVK